MTVRKRIVNPICLLTNDRDRRAINHTRLRLPDTASVMNPLGTRDAEKRAPDEVDGKELTGIILPKGGDVVIVLRP